MVEGTRTSSFGGAAPASLEDAGLLASGISPARDAAAELDLVTYNIHSCIGTDRRFDPPRIAQIIRSIDADIIGLQEVGWHLRGHAGFDQFQYLEKATGYYVYPGLTKYHHAAHFGNALLTRVPARHVRSINLSVPYRVPRAAIDADLDFGGVSLRVINAHFGLDPWERRIQLGRIARALDGSPAPTVLVGDFNEWRLNAPPFRDIEHHLPHCVAAPSFHTRMPTLRFDRIYASEDLQILTRSVVETEMTRRASDHLPVRARLRIAPAGASPCPPPVPHASLPPSAYGHEPVSRSDRPTRGHPSAYPFSTPIGRS